jgi:hypothetical protein
LRLAILIRKLIIATSLRIARAVLIRLAEDIELMQILRSSFSSADFVSAKLRSASVTRDRDALLRNALNLVSIDGIVCEFGVYKGHTLRIIANTLRNTTIYGFDSFEGLPETWRSGFEKGTFSVELTDFPKFPGNVKLYPGLFETTLPHMLADDPRSAAFLHIDCDLYSSTKCIFNLLSTRLNVGTVVVFDEYLNFPGWENDEHRALVEAAAEIGFEYEYLFYNPSGQQVAISITKILTP